METSEQQIFRSPVFGSSVIQVPNSARTQGRPTFCQCSKILMKNNKWAYYLGPVWIHQHTSIPYILNPSEINVTSFSSISYYSNLRLTSKMLYEQRHLTLVSDLIQWQYKIGNSQSPIRGKPDPYPHSNGGQTLGTHWSCPTLPLHLFSRPVWF